MAFTFRNIADVKTLKGARVLIRVDFNVPLHKGKILEQGDTRIREGLSTIKLLKKKGARVIIVSHLGRPEGWEKRLSLKPVAARLEQLLRSKVLFVGDSLENDEKVEKRLDAMKHGDVAVLENIRFYAGEEKNERFFGRRLASLADIFVNDAFGVSHRAHASTVGAAGHLPAYAGLLVARELENLSKLLHSPKKPFVVLMGGAKLSTKLPTLEKLLKTADAILIGGGMANGFIRAHGHSVGKSKVAPKDLRKARTMMKKRKIIVPVDVIATDRPDDRGYIRVAKIDDIRPDEYVVDIGPETIRRFAGRIKEAKTIAWNGPLGLYEVKKFSHGSVILGRVVASRSSGPAFGVVGGGDTLPCLERTGMAEYVDHVSTGGGAMLDLLAGKPLPGIAALADE